MVTINTETTDAQNTVARLSKQIYLNVDNPSTKIKKQFYKVKRAIIDLHMELDILNDLKGEQ